MLTAPRRTFQLRYVAAFLTLIASVIIRLVASNGNPSPSVQDVYGSIESRIGYWLLLGNTRHGGLYRKDQLSPFPISAAQRAMEEKLYTRLGLEPGSRVLDAGAGSGYVAIYMARKGLNVQAIDITPHHLADARKNIKKQNLEAKIAVEYGDYHNISYPDESFNGIYTMETFVHADDPVKVLRNFYRLLKPGGVLVLHEADYKHNSPALQHRFRLSHCQNILEEGKYQELVEEVGFKDYSLEDLTDNVLPLWRFFGLLGYLPLQIFRLLGIQDRFINTMAGVDSWLHWGEGRYISVRAVKP